MNTDEMNRVLKRGEELCANGDVEAGLKCFETILTHDSRHAGALNNLGVIAFRRKMYDDAQRFLLRATESLPPSTEAVVNLGHCFFEKGDFEEAARWFEKGRRVGGDNARLLNCLGECFMRLGEPVRARDAFTSSYRIDPGQQSLQPVLTKLNAELVSAMDTPPRIMVISPSDGIKDEAQRKLWGDHWVKHELERAFGALGIEVVDRSPDVLLYLFGMPVRGLPEGVHNMVWVYSHVDKITPRTLAGFDRIFCLSPSYIPTLRGMGYRNIEPMIGATSKVPVRVENRYDIVFVGNSRGPGGRPVIDAIGDVPYRFKVWGDGWDQVLPERYLGGLYHDYESLDELYASSLISINDHHPDMAREGFVAVKVFDILASGGFAVSDLNKGIDEIFGDSVPQYRSPGHLRDLLDFYLSHPHEREELMRKGRAIALSHTWRRRAEQCVNGFMPALAGRAARRSAGPPRSVDRAGAAAPSLKVLYVDTLSAAHAACNVNGMVKAYRKVCTLKTFDYRGLAERHGAERMNRMLVDEAVAFAPDLIHVGKGESIAGATIGEIKNRIDTCVIHFYGDFRWDPQPWVVDIGRHADRTLFSHTDERVLGRYRDAGVKHLAGFWDAGTDPEVFYPRGVPRTMDVVFMGNNLDIPHDGYHTRRRLIEGAVEAGFDVHVYGHGWDYLTGPENLHVHEFVTEDEFARVCSGAKIVLGINGVNDVRMYASWRRTVNTMACGAFHLTHYVPGMETLFRNREHLVWFESVAEALDLIDHYLTHDRERDEIAGKGREEVLRAHTWDARISRMLDVYHGYRNVPGTSDGPPGGTQSVPDSMYERRVRGDGYAENPELDDDMVESMFIRWKRGRFLLEPAQRRMYEELALRVKGLDVCDVGCGSGLGSVILAQKAHSVVGMEKIGSCTEFSRKCFPLENVRYVNEDVVHTSIPDERFDAVVAIEVIEHVADYHGALRNLKRILKKGGTLYVSSPNRNNRNLGEHGPKNKYHVREWTIREFYETLSMYFPEIQFFDCTLTRRQGPESMCSPVIAVCENRLPVQVETPDPVVYNLNFDDLLPSYKEFSLLEGLVRLVPDIKITIFLPVNSRDWGDGVNNIAQFPEWCRKVAGLPRKNFEIALHGNIHHLDDPAKTPEFKTLSREDAKNLLRYCEESLRKAGIPFTRGFRPPRWEMGEGCRRALEELDYLYVSDHPKFFELHKEIGIPRIFSNSDIRENQEYMDVKPYQHIIPDARKLYIHRGHLVSRCANNLTLDNFANIVKTIRSFPSVEFKFLSEIAEDMRRCGAGSDARIPSPAGARPGPVKLHLGCGSVHLDGYVNIDVENWAGACDLTADAKKLSMFDDDSVDHIFNHALLEHLPPWDTMTALGEWHRALKPGGTIQIEVPDLERIFEDWLVKGTLGEQEAVDNIFGGNKSPRKAYTHQDHLTGFTYDRLTRMMSRCGFERFERLEHPRYHHILVVKGRKAVETVPIEAGKAGCEATEEGICRGREDHDSGIQAVL